MARRIAYGSKGASTSGAARKGKQVATFEQTEDMLRKKTMSRLAMKLIKSIFNPMTYVEAVRVIQRHYHPEHRSRENDRLRLLFACFACVICGYYAKAIYTFEIRLSTEKVIHYVVDYAVLIKSILDSEQGREISNFVYSTVMTLIGRYGPTFLALNFLPVEAVREKFKYRIIATVAIRESLRVVPKANEAFDLIGTKSMEATNNSIQEVKSLFAMMKKAFNSILEKAPGLDKTNTGKVIQFTEEIDRMVKARTRDPGLFERLRSVIVAWAIIFHSFLFRKQMEYASRVVLHVAQEFLHIIAHVFVVVRHVPALAYTETKLRQLANWLPTLGNDNLSKMRPTRERISPMNRFRNRLQTGPPPDRRPTRPQMTAPAALGISLNNANTANSGGSKSVRRPASLLQRENKGKEPIGNRGTARSGSHSIPTSRDDLIDYVYEHGGRTTYTKGARKGQTRNTRDLRLEAKRIHSPNRKG